MMPRRSKKGLQTGVTLKTKDEKIQTESTAIEKGENKPTQLAEPGTVTSLGDFTSIKKSLTTFKPFHNILRSDCPGDGAVQLGNLSKIINQLRESNSSPDQGGDVVTEPSPPRLVGSSAWAKQGDLLKIIHKEHSHVASSESRARSEPVLNGQKSEVQAERATLPSPTTRPKSILKRKQGMVSSSDSDRDTPNYSEHNDTLTPATTPPTPPGKSVQTASSKETARRHTQARTDLLAVLRQDKKPPEDRPFRAVLFEYRGSRLCDYEVVVGVVRTEEEAHESLGVKLITQYTKDRITAINHPSITANGIHVFLDWSNIDISFQHTMKLKHNLPESGNFKTAPKLNMGFLHEILTRGRTAHTLKVGCSIKPGEKRSARIDDLKQLGYDIDLRERRRVQDPPGPEDPFCSGRIRYVEDLVDETLQGRIGGAVLEYYNRMGTIVLVTGDAKPAQYSDGFFAYVDRLLHIGWNVEVVSWNSSLSESWRELNSSGHWPDEFRIIELDDFIDELFACYRKESA